MRAKARLSLETALGHVKILLETEATRVKKVR